MPFVFPPAIEEWMERLGGRRRVMIAGVGLLTVVLILGISRWASAPTYVAAFNDLPLETVGKITASLDQESIPYRLEHGGTELSVPADQLAHVRVLLAGEGLPAQGRPGLELFDQPSWGMTDFAQRINYRRALEGELERTIGKMSGVESAQVHLAMDATRTFQSDDRPKEASVVLALRNGGEPSPEVVSGIQHLVASSVGGLQSASVTVLDDSGRMLSAPNEPGSIAALTSQQLGMQREVEGYLERKAQSLVNGVLGRGDARVKVAAEINFDRVERTTQSVDPDGQVLASEQKAQIIPGPQGGAGSTNTSATYQNSTSMESFTGATGNVKRLSVAVVVDEKQVPQGDSLVFVPRTDAELAQIETLVANAVGLDPSRGDRISVASMRFSPPPLSAPAPKPTALSLVGQYHKEIVAILGLLIAAFVALRVVRSLRGPAPGQAPLELSAGSSPEALPEPAASKAHPAVNHPMPRRTLTSANQRTRQEVLNSVEDGPEVAARVIRAWLKEA